jgi:hypothetical protein
VEEIQKLLELEVAEIKKIESGKYLFYPKIYRVYKSGYSQTELS